MSRPIHRSRSKVLWGVAVLAAVACGGERQQADIRGGKDVTDREDRTDFGGLAMTVTANKAVYAVAEPIALTLRVRNSTDAPITLRFATGQRYDFVIESAAGAEVWRWSADRAFTQAQGAQIAPPGWELDYNETFGGRLAPGTYRVRGLLTSVGDTLEARAEVVVRQ